MHSLSSYLRPFGLLFLCVSLTLYVPRVRVFICAVPTMLRIVRLSGPLDAAPPTPPPHFTGSFIFIEGLLMPVNSTL
jgi:hypothetical protein